MIGQISTRRLRVVKYRGTTHGTNEYPFLIDEEGISVLPITASGLDYDVSNERVPTGVAGLDDMLGGGGYYRAVRCCSRHVGNRQEQRRCATRTDYMCAWREVHVLFF